MALNLNRLEVEILDRAVIVQKKICVGKLLQLASNQKYILHNNKYTFKVNMVAKLEIDVDVNIWMTVVEQTGFFHNHFCSNGNPYKNFLHKI